MNFVDKLCLHTMFAVVSFMEHSFYINLSLAVNFGFHLNNKKLIAALFDFHVIELFELFELH